QVDQAFTQRREPGVVLLVRLRRGGVEDDIDLVEIRQRDQAFDTLMGGRDLHAGGAGQTVGRGIDTDHRAHFQEPGMPHDLDHQIGADIARPDDRDLGAFVVVTHWETSEAVVKEAETVPRPEMAAVTVAPGCSGRIGPSAPERITWPARSGSPKVRACCASQDRALSGSPRQAAPLPVETSSPSMLMLMVTSMGSKSSRVRRSVPST